MLADTHAHLSMDAFDPDREAVVQRASEAGIERILDIGTDLKSSRKAVQISEQFDTVYAVAGIHPHDASKAKNSDFPELEKLLLHPRVKAVGEIGLDYHYDFSPRNIQRDIFTKQLHIAVSNRKPVVIHVREAMADALEIIQQIDVSLWEGVFHCFGGDIEDVRNVLDLGFHISFTGVVTFPNYKNFDLIRSVPLNRLLVETDAPYMTPVPHRGKRNEPAYLLRTVHRLAEILEVSFERLSEQTTVNAKRLFRLEH